MKKIGIVLLCCLICICLVSCNSSTNNDISPSNQTNSVTESPGIGGELDYCQHQFFYHSLSGFWPAEMIEPYVAAFEAIKYDENGNFDASRVEDCNIVNFVQHYNITREQFIEMADWTVHETWDGDLDKPALAHYRDCPYTYNQFLDAIFGDNPALSEWVFSQETVKNLTVY